MTRTTRLPALALVLMLVCNGVAQDAGTAPAPAGVEALLTQLATIELDVSVDRSFDLAATELDQALAAAGTGVQQDPRVAAAVARIRGAIEEARSQDRGAIEEAVWRAAAEGDEGALSAIGRVAVDLLLEGVRAGKTRQVLTASNTVRNNSPDSMLWLAFELDAERTVGFLRDERLQLKAQGLSVAQFLVQALYETYWSVAPGQLPVPADPALLDVLADELEDMRLPEDRSVVTNLADSVLGTLAKFGALTQRQCDALAALPRDQSWSPISRILHNLSAETNAGFWPASAQPFFDAVLDDPRADVRRPAAAFLARGPRSIPLLTRAEDPDVQVRKLVADSLRAHSFGTRVWPGRDVASSGQVETWVPPATEPEARKALLRLVADPEAVVRESAARAVLEQPEQVPADVIEQLADDPDAGVREVMTGLKHPDSALQTRVLLQLARGDQPLVLDQLDERLASWDWHHDEDDFLAVLRERLHHPTLPFGAAGRGGLYADDSLEVLATRPDGRRALTRWFLETGELLPLRHVVNAMLEDEGTSYSTDELEIWLSLEPSAYARLLPALHDLSWMLASGLLDQLEGSLRQSEIADSLQPLLRDVNVPAALRLQLAVFVTRVRPTSERVADVEWLLLSDAVRRWQPEKDWQKRYLSDAAGSVPQPARNALLARLVASERLSDDQLGRLLETYSASDDGGADLTREILQRWLVDLSPGTDQAVRKALTALASLDTPESLEWLRAAAHSVALEETAIEALGRRPEPEAMQILGECIGSPWVSEPQRREQLSYDAIHALTSRLSEEAVDVLLQGAARSPTANTRNSCLFGVETIRKYLDALADWQRRKSTSATRDEAVGRLVGLLHDPDAAIRAEAVRGLATLGAVEHLPDMIEALRDADATVREAARAALQQLQSAGAGAEAPGR